MMRQNRAQHGPTRLRRHTIGRRRAFTLTEIVIAATLSSLFAALVAQTIATGVRITTDTTAQVAAETRAREVFRTTTSALRGATPLGVCQAPAAGAPLSSCERIGSRKYAIIEATPERITFFSQRSTGDDPLAAPDLVRLTYSVDKGNMNTAQSVAENYATLTVTRWSDPSGTIISPSPLWASLWENWSDGLSSFDETRLLAVASGETLRVGVMDGKNQPAARGNGCGTERQVLTYYNSSGVELRPNSGCKLDQTQLGQIAMVRIDAQMSYRKKTTAGTFKLAAAVAISSRAYSEDL